MKYGAGSAEGLSVHTGNHMRVPGKYYRSIANDDKLNSGQNFDLDVIVKRMFGLDVMLLFLQGLQLVVHLL